MTNFLKVIKWSSRSEAEYHALPPGEPDDNDAKRAALPAWWTSPRVLQACVLFLLLSLLTVTSMNIYLLRQRAPPQRQDCGNSLQEAKGLGCTFDNLVKAWLPPQCPRYGQDDFSQAGMAVENGSAWRYYVDRAGSRELTLQEMAEMAHEREGGPRWWTTGREHMTHCTWMMIRIAHVLSTGDRQDLLVRNFEHAKHCAMFMLERALEAGRLEEIRVEGNTAFGYC